MAVSKGARSSNSAPGTTTGLPAASTGPKLSPEALLILTSLAGGAKHGYAMIEDIQSITGVRLGPGTLYGAIGRLEAEGKIEALQSDDRRRPYQITPLGRRHLETEIGGMKGLVAIGLRRLKRA